MKKSIVVSTDENGNLKNCGFFSSIEVAQMVAKREKETGLDSMLISIHKSEPEAVEDILNNLSFSQKDFCDEFARTAHRYVQNEFTLLCLEWLKTCASDDYRYDARNENSHNAAKQIINNNPTLF